MRQGFRSPVWLVAVVGLALGVPVFGTVVEAPVAVAGTSCVAGPLTVTTNADSATPGTLRTALTNASGVASAQTICIDTTLVTAPIVAGSDLPTLANTTGPLTIEGNGATVDGNGHVLIDDASSALLTVDAITLTGGHNSNGGGILEGAFPTPGSVVVTNSTIVNNTSDDLGGGIFVGGHGSLTVINSTIAGNTAHNAGGGMEADAGVTITNSTISGNTAASEGGGLFSEVATVTNSTVANNTAGSEGGGGILVEGTLTLVYATVVGNTAPNPTGANIDGFSDTALTSFGSVVASPQGGGTNCAALTGTTSQGWNWDDDGTCGFGAGTGDHSDGGNPELGALANNGGSTQTLLPAAASPLIDAIPVASCGAGIGITTDQIGTTRPQGPGCDVGAVEVPVVTPTTPSPAAPTPVVTAPTFTG
jgi:Right handed beta helix region